MSKMGEIEIHNFPSNVNPNISTEDNGGMRVGAGNIWFKLPGNLGWVRNDIDRSSIGACAKIKEFLEGKYERVKESK